jgi:5-methylcytosine-specific restriction endonuclease McrA
MKTIEQEIEEYLIQQAIGNGISRVKRACRNFLKRKTIVGVLPTIRKAVPRSWTMEAARRQKYVCARCKHKFETLEDIVGDHIIPIIKGGEHVSSNIQALHRSCNASKGSNDLIKEAKLTGQTITQMLKN